MGKEFSRHLSGHAKRCFDLPHTIPVSRVRIGLTAYGFLFLVILGAMLAGSINYNNNAGFLLVFMLGSLMMVSSVHTLRNLAGLRLLSMSAPAVFAGDHTVFTLRLAAGAAHRSALEFQLGPADPVRVYLVAGQTETVRLEVPVPSRGWHACPVLAITSRYPFGVLRARFAGMPPAGCLAYPRPLKGPAGRVPWIAPGRDGAARASGVDDFLGLIQYQPGHHVGRIAWKALSRGQGVFVKQFGSPALDTVMFELDRTMVKDIESQLSWLCAAVLTASAAGQVFGIRLGTHVVPPGTGVAHKAECLKTLAMYEPEP